MDLLHYVYTHQWAWSKQCTTLQHWTTNTKTILLRSQFPFLQFVKSNVIGSYAVFISHNATCHKSNPTPREVIANTSVFLLWTASFPRSNQQPQTLPKLHSLLTPQGICSVLTRNSFWSMVQSTATFRGYFHAFRCDQTESEMHSEDSFFNDNKQRNLHSKTKRFVTRCWSNSN